MTEGNKEKAFYVMVFYSTMDTISTEKKLKNSFKTFIIPTPREISKSCGFAIRFADFDEAELMKACDEIEVPYSLYLIDRDGDGERKSYLIKGKEVK